MVRRPTAADDFRNVRQHVRLGGRDRSLRRRPRRRRSAPRWAGSRTRALARPCRRASRSSSTSGDDSRNEYIYKFVSTANWDPADADRAALAAGDKYLDAGKLYVAKFNADGTGSWLELAFGRTASRPRTPAYAFADQADVLINTRLAADAAGATKMDRPEWGAVNPRERRGLPHADQQQRRAAPARGHRCRQPALLQRSDAADGTAQSGNPNGHIIRWPETGDDPEAPTFTLGHLSCSARASTADAGERQPLRPHRRQRLLEPRRPVVQPRATGILLDPDRRRRLHRRHQLHDARRAAGRASATAATQDDHQHRRARRDQAGDDLRRRALGDEAEALPGRPQGVRDHRRRPRRRTAGRCSSTSSIPARDTAPNFANLARSAATGRTAARLVRARRRS